MFDSRVRASASTWSNAGARAAAAWITARGVAPPKFLRWHVEVSLDVVDAPVIADLDDRVDTRFQLDIYAEEWGFFFCHAGRVSWIRVTDIAFAHGRDEFALLARTPPLDDIGGLVRAIERDHHIAFHRQHARVRTNIANAEPAIRQWIESL